MLTLSTLKKVNILFLISVLILSSCTKEGCVDKNALNFDAKADKDDGSCLFNPEVGEAHQGGYVAYVFESGDQGYVEGEFHGLITTKIDQALENEWGCIGTLVGASNSDIGNGSNNTSLILANCSEVEIAAKICNDFSFGGYDDWYLPSRDELNKLYENKDLIGGFANASYWSSTEQDEDFVWGQSFNIGSQFLISKDNTFRVRAIRKF